MKDEARARRRGGARLLFLGIGLLVSNLGSAPVSAAVQAAQPPAPAAADTGRWVRAPWGDSASGREYRLYVPPGATAGMPLLVVLHGCTQTADAIAAATRFNTLAAERTFLVLYPEQPMAAHPLRCWNWYDVAHQRRDAGEPALIAELTRGVMAEYRADTTRVHLAGISAGALMAGIVAASYPDLYDGLALHSGGSYAPAATLEAATAMMRGELPDAEERAEAAYRAMGAAAKARPVLILHGAADAVVHPSNADAAARQWLRTNVLALGVAGAGGSTAAAGGVTGRPVAGVAAPDGAEAVEPDVEHGSTGGYVWERRRWTAGGVPVERWRIEGLGHAWSGGLAGGSYSDPAGPDATRIIVNFLLGAP